MPFEKGKSGNPSGRPKIAEDVKILARKHDLDAIKTLVGIMKDKKAPHASRVAASNSILDRGYGKPAQAITGDSEGGPLKIELVRFVYDPPAE